jgi:hypothetical protein
LSHGNEFGGGYGIKEAEYRSALHAGAFRVPFSSPSEDGQIEFSLGIGDKLLEVRFGDTSDRIYVRG